MVLYRVDPSGEVANAEKKSRQHYHRQRGSRFYELAYSSFNCEVELRRQRLCRIKASKYDGVMR